MFDYHNKGEFAKITFPSRYVENVIELGWQYYSLGS